LELEGFYFGTGWLLPWNWNVSILELECFYLGTRMFPPWRQNGSTWPKHDVNR